MRSQLLNPDWQGTAVSTSNLSELELMLGDIAGASKTARDSVDYAKYSGILFQTQTSQAILADALHQEGKRAAAEKLFVKVKDMGIAIAHQSKTPCCPLLHSLTGFRYCDLLLAKPERIAWHKFISPYPLPSYQIFQAITQCSTVEQHSKQIFEWRNGEYWNPKGDSLLDKALDHLTPGRAALYATILDSPLILDTAISLVTEALNNLRQAGHQEYLTCGLLTHAWLRALTGLMNGPDSAQADLDEAWEIAERGPMPLFLADIHLHRAHLFGRADGVPYPWDSPQADLTEARTLIKKHSYWRRKDELEDAERASNTWPS
jgi:hypothetical protein